MAKGKDFAAQVSRYARGSQDRLEAIFKTAVQAVAEDANTPVAEGGRMRIDTSFLRNSQKAALNAVPTGPSNGKTDAQGNPDDVALVIAGASINDVIWIGWTANYARFREYKDGFLITAAGRWQKQVSRASAEARRRRL